MKIGIFTLTKDRDYYTKKMLQALNDKTKLPFDHFFIDQGSTDTTLKLLSEFPTNQDCNRFVYPLKKNIGINRAVNFAVDRMKDYDIIIKYDNDMEAITDGWLYKCLEAMQTNMLLSPYIDGLLENRGGVMRTGEKAPGNISLSYAIGGMVMIGLNKAWTKDSNGWTIPAALHAGGDMDFCYKLSLEGYVFGYKEDVIIKHMDTSLGQMKKYPEYFKLRGQEKVTIL